MKTVIVKIDRSTIRKNPNAGRTETMISEGLQFFFVFVGTKEPKWIKKDGVYVTGVNYQGSDLVNQIMTIEGEIVNNELIEKIKKNHFEKGKFLPGTTITVKNNLRTLHHMPGPQYLFEYEKTYLKCKNCKKDIEVQDIDVDYIFDGEGEVKVESCPVCNAENCFDNYEFEHL